MPTKLFFGGQGTNGLSDLWVSDGTPGGTSEIDVVGANTESGIDPSDIVGFDGLAYFAGVDAAGNTNLWVSDGTISGTSELVIPGQGTSFSPKSMAVLDGKLYMFGTDSNGRTSLWVSDGTAAGTTELSITGLTDVDGTPTVFNGNLYFAGTDTNGRNELWVSDGTASGTRELAVANQYAGGGFPPGAAGLNPTQLTVVGNQLYFSGVDANGSTGLWVSDGTAGGTNEVANTAGLTPGGLVAFEDKIYFASEQDGGLWVSDGTAIGTAELAVSGAEPAGIGAQDLVVYNGNLYFNGLDTSGNQELWVSDGTGAGTQEIAIPDAGSGGYGPEPGYLTVVNGELLFTAFDSNNTYGLWETNGTAEGTSEISIAGTSTSGFFPFDVTAVAAMIAPPADLTLSPASDTGTLGDDITYDATPVITGAGTPGDTVSLYDNGSTTPIGTQAVSQSGTWSITTTYLATGTNTLTAKQTDGNTNSAASSALTLTIEAAPAVATPTLFFGGADADGQDNLWVSDGTAAGTTEIVPAGINSYGLQPGDITDFDGKAYFWGVDAAGDSNLWVSNGTAAGTSELIIPGQGTSFNPGDMVVYDDKLYIASTDDDGNSSLWVSNGTAAGTTELSVTGLTGVVGTPVIYDGKLYFAGVDEAGQTGLWVSDGTGSGTYQLSVANAYSGGMLPFQGGLDPRFLTVVGSKLFFVGDDSNNELGLWVIDGPAGSTTSSTDSDAQEVPGTAGLSPSNLAAYGGNLYFGSDQDGALWGSDGTAGGTVERVVQGAYASGLVPEDLTVYNGEIYFEGTDTEHNYGLWVTDGTAASTHEITIQGAQYDSENHPDVSNLVVMNGELYFSAADANGEYGLWASNGTSGGTSEVSTSGTGSNGLAPHDLTAVTSVVAPPSAPALAPSDPGGPDATNETDPTLVGSGTPGDMVTIYDGSTVEGTATVDEDGTWAASVMLSDGIFALTATQTDGAGNVSASSSAFSLTILQETLAAPTLSQSPDTTAPSEPMVGGTAQAGSTITVYDDGTSVGRATTDASGNWRFSFPESLAAGTYTVIANASDAAGNVSPTSAPVTIIEKADGSYQISNTGTNGTTTVSSYGSTGALTEIDTVNSSNEVLESVTGTTATLNIYDASGNLVGTVLQPSTSVTETPSFQTQTVGGTASTSTGTAGSQINLLAGGNTIVSQGNDTVNAGPGADTISATGPSILVNGGSGQLFLATIATAVTVTGGSGSSTVFGGTGGGLLKGGSAGVNVLIAGGGTTTLEGGGAGDTLVSAAGTNTIAMQNSGVAFGGSGSTTAFAATQDTLVGGSGSNLMISSGTGNQLWAGSGNSTLFGGGSDTLAGGSGSSTLVAASGNVTFLDGGGSETVSGGSGNDTVFANQGGTMTIVEGNGNNTVLLAGGENTVYGGTGANVYDFVPGTQAGTDVITGFSVGTDQIALFGAESTGAVVTSSGGNTFLDLSDGTKVTLLGVMNATLATLT